MSEDELNKLAAAMHNVKPSKASRKRGMEAAMAAFDMEFASEAVSETVSEAVTEKNTQSSQGSTQAARPTGQSIGNGPVQTLGSGLMAKLDNIFFNPKAMTLMGSCAAALIAAMIYLPNVDTQPIEPAIVSTVSEDLAADELTNPAVKISGEASSSVDEDVKTRQFSAETGDIVNKATEVLEDVAAVETIGEPLVESEADAAVSEALTAEVRPDTGISKDPAVKAPAIVSAPRTKFEPEADSSVEGRINFELNSVDRGDEPRIAASPEVAAAPIAPATPEKHASLDGSADIDSNIITVQRRVVKTPASVQERVVPSLTKTQTRRVLKKAGTPTGRRLPAVTKQVARRVVKTPAATQERVVPAITKEFSRRVKTDDGSFKTVTGTIVVQDASSELVTVPRTFETVTETVVVLPERDEYVAGTAEYETVAEAVVVQEASTELVTVPAVYETITETIEIQADGSTRVISSETVPSPTAPTLAASSGFTSSAARPTSVVVAPTSASVTTGKTSGGISSVSSLHSKIRPDGGASTASRAESGPLSWSASGSDEIAAFGTVASAPSAPVTSAPAEVYDEIIVTSSSRKRGGLSKIFSPIGKAFKGKSKDASRVAAPPPPAPVAPAVDVAEAKPRPAPQSGLLTAGDYDDVLNPHLYKVYLDKMLQGHLTGKDLPYVDANQRINIRVVDRFGKAVPAANISLTNASGKKLFPLRTGADGMAYLYPNFDNLQRGMRLKVSAKGARTVSQSLTEQLIQTGGDLKFNLSMSAQPVDSLDLLLTIDATGSMGDEMRYLQTELKAIVGRVEQAHPGLIYVRA